jgi:CrcB protein
MLLHVAIGGLLGTLARWWMSGTLATPGAGLPRGTLAVNLLGSLVIGFVMRYGTETLAWSPEVRTGITIGFCGAFTTMSTLAYEAVQLATTGQFLRAAAYLIVTVVGCLAAVVAGSQLAGRLL